MPIFCLELIERVTKIQCEMLLFGMKWKRGPETEKEPYGSGSFRTEA